MISVVVVVNDARLFDSMLGASLARQGTAHELIIIDNVGGRFASAASAMTHGGQQARGDFLMFAHQDVSFEEAAWLATAEHLLRSLPDAGIAGVAGARSAADTPTREILSNIEDSVPPQRAGHRSLVRPERVDSVDECAFFVPRSVFERDPFDARTCDGWHLYAVDYGLSVRTRGLHAYALPLPLYHRSRGRMVRRAGMVTLEPAYFRTLGRVLAKHRAHFDLVHTTCGTWDTRKNVTLQQYPPKLVGRAACAWLGSLWTRGWLRHGGLGP